MAVRAGGLATGMRALVYERHLIFFAPVASSGGQPVILRIVHQARDIRRDRLQ